MLGEFQPPPPSQGKPPQRWYRLEQFAERYRVSERTIHRWKADGLIRIASIGGIRFVDDDHFSKHLDDLTPDHEQQPT